MRSATCICHLGADKPMDVFGGPWENYVEKITDRMTDLEDSSLTEDMEEKRKVKNKITVFPRRHLRSPHLCGTELWKKLSFNRQKKKNELSDVPGDSRGLYVIIYRRDPEKSVRDNYQYQYAKRLRNKNIWVYHDKHRIAKRNISMLTELLKKHW